MTGGAAAPREQATGQAVIAAVAILGIVLACSRPAQPPQPGSAAPGASVLPAAAASSTTGPVPFSQDTFTAAPPAPPTAPASPATSSAPPSAAAQRTSPTGRPLASPVPSAPVGPARDPFDLQHLFLGIGGAVAGVSPDATVAAGPNSLVLARNNGIAIIPKPVDQRPAAAVAQMRLYDFLARVTAAGERVTDPVVLFDSESERFFLVNAAQSGPDGCTAPGRCLSHIQIAVSRSSDPRTLSESDWYFYALDRTLERTAAGAIATDNQGDFDHIAFVGDKLIIGWQSTNAHPTGSEGVGRGGRVRILDKRPFLEGQPVTTWVDLITPERPRPAIVYDPRDRATQGDRAFFEIQTGCNSATQRRTWLLGAVSGLAGTPLLELRTIESPFLCEVSALTAPQPAGAMPIDVVHWATQPMYRAGRLWLVDATGDTRRGAVTAIYWAELDVQSWPNVRVVQSGVFGQDGISYYGIGFAVDPFGGLVIVYARSGPNDFVSSYYTGRLSSDPPGVLRAERPLKTGSMTYVFIDIGRNRFIDYSWATVDPVDGSVWMIGLVPVPGPPGSGDPWSDAWIGHVRPGPP